MGRQSSIVVVHYLSSDTLSLSREVPIIPAVHNRTVTRQHTYNSPSSALFLPFSLSSFSTTAGFLHFFSGHIPIMEMHNVLSACGKNHEAAATDAAKDSLIETHAQRLAELENLFLCSLATQHVQSRTVEVQRLRAVNAELIQDNMDQLHENEELLKDFQTSTSEIEDLDEEVANQSEIIDFFKTANNDLCEQHTELAEELERDGIQLISDLKTQLKYNAQIFSKDKASLESQIQTLLGEKREITDQLELTFKEKQALQKEVSHHDTKDAQLKSLGTQLLETQEDICGWTHQSDCQSKPITRSSLETLVQNTESQREKLVTFLAVIEKTGRSSQIPKKSSQYMFLMRRGKSDDSGLSTNNSVAYGLRQHQDIRSMQQINESFSSVLGEISCRESTTSNQKSLLQKIPMGGDWVSNDFLIECEGVSSRSVSSCDQKKPDHLVSQLALDQSTVSSTQGQLRDGSVTLLKRGSQTDDSLGISFPRSGSRDENGTVDAFLPNMDSASSSMPIISTKQNAKVHFKDDLLEGFTPDRKRQDTCGISRSSNDVVFGRIHCSVNCEEPLYTNRGGGVGHTGRFDEFTSTAKPPPDPTKFQMKHIHAVYQIY
jgi:hypothetical protein